MKTSELTLITILIHVLLFSKKYHPWSLLALAASNNIISRKPEKVHTFPWKSVNSLFFLIENVKVHQCLADNNLTAYFYLENGKHQKGLS